MPMRAPVLSDFPSNIIFSIVPPPASTSAASAPRNILLLLHGLGDTHASFTALGRSMALPETLCISLRAPSPLPLDMGASGPDGSFHWGVDIVFDPSKSDGGMDVEGAGYSRAVKMIAVDIIMNVLIGECGYSLRDIVLFGMGQGGTAALGAARSLGANPATQAELGGIISLGGALPEEWKRLQGSDKCKTPVLVTHGRSNSAISTIKARELKDAFEFVEIQQWDRPGDGMARNRQEMLPIMKFFAKRLRSREGVPEGAVELT